MLQFYFSISPSGLFVHTGFRLSHISVGATSRNVVTTSRNSQSGRHAGGQSSCRPDSYFSSKAVTGTAVTGTSLTPNDLFLKYEGDKWMQFMEATEMVLCYCKLILGRILGTNICTHSAQTRRLNLEKILPEIRRI